MVYWCEKLNDVISSNKTDVVIGISNLAWNPQRINHVNEYFVTITNRNKFTRRKTTNPMSCCQCLSCQADGRGCRGKGRRGGGGAGLHCVRSDHREPGERENASSTADFRSHIENWIAWYRRQRNIGALEWKLILASSWSRSSAVGSGQLRLPTRRDAGRVDISMVYDKDHYECELWRAQDIHIWICRLDHYSHNTTWNQIWYRWQSTWHLPWRAVEILNAHVAII